ncbi:MAG: GspH/FimT family pseudopilin [Burkholderiaceae bacterium]|jgi:type IV fimbrial biogenesis protein FimT
MSHPNTLNPNNPALTHKQSRTTALGFTLIELLVSLSIVAVLSGVAIPTFAHIRTEQRINAASKAMHNSIAVAKSQALRLGQTILITPAGCTQDTKDLSALLAPPARTTRSGNSWPCGWLVLADTNKNAAADVNDALLHYVAGIEGVRISNNVTADTLRIMPSGVVSPMQSMHFCPSSNTTWSNFASKLVVAISGRTRTESLRDGAHCADS